MILDDLTQRFINKPGYLDKGAGYLSKQFKCSKGDIYKAKEQARKVIHGLEVAELQDIIATQEELITYLGSETNENGTTKQFITTRPLSPKEIEEMAGVDGVNTYIARVWDKMLPSGQWTYSIDIRYRVENFYNTEQLKLRLAELMPDLKPSARFPLTKAQTLGNQALVIVLADDHVGAINKTNLFNNKPLSYGERLLKVAEEVKTMGCGFEEVHIVSLGDQMNGWNKQTTRGGHIVDSLSNEQQFDLYVEARVDFYNEIFTSGISENYFVHDIENSNHSGLGMSYMANRTLEMYLDAKFPHVVRESMTEMIGGFQYGKHVILMGHGKDEKFMKRAMPAVLNPATDLYLYDFAQNKGYSPYNDNITFYKGDLHQLGIQHGKFGRYINVQSVAGNSDYGDLNYGNTKGGALLEVLQKDESRVISIPIWF